MSDHDDLDPVPQIPSIVWPTVALVALLVLAVLAAIATSTLHGAPVPKKPAPKKAPAVKAPPFVGSWSMHWRGVDAPVILYAHGGWWCHWCGQEWVGQWRMTVAGRLDVEEWVKPDKEGERPTATCRWSVVLDGSGVAGQITQYETSDPNPGDELVPVWGVFRLRKP